MKTPRLSKRFVVAAAAVMLTFLGGGCATPAKSTAMVAQNPVVKAQHSESVSVSVGGGAETSSLGASNVSNQDFAEAIKLSIEQSKLFANVVPDGTTPDYQIHVQIVRLDRPIFGTSFTVNMEATWRLLDGGNQKVLWEKAITSSYTATMGDAFAGVTRLRLANEGAARLNIANAIKHMSSVTLP